MNPIDDETDYHSAEEVSANPYPNVCKSPVTTLDYDPDIFEKDTFQHHLQKYLLEYFASKQLSSISVYCPFKQELKQQIEKDYNDFLRNKAAGTGDYRLEDHLAAASHVQKEFLNFHVRASFHDDGHDDISMLPKFRQDAFEVMESCLRLRIMYYCHCDNNMESLTPADAAKIITWMEDFASQSGQAFPDVEIPSSWKFDIQKLFDHYLDYGVLQHLRQITFVTMDLRTSTDLRKSRKGHVMTDHPLSISTILDAELKVVKACLPPVYTMRVLAACNHVISAMVLNLTSQVQTSHQNMGLSRYCAIMNDVARLSRYMERRNTKYLTGSEYAKTGTYLANNFLQLSRLAVQLLCERIMADLKKTTTTGKAVLTTIGRSNWESGDYKNGGAVLCTTATLLDYLKDIERWLLPGIFFPQILKRCFDMMLKQYVESFFLNTIAKGIKEPEVVSKRLADDYSRLVAFFNGDLFEEYYGQGDFYTIQDINFRLHILKSLSNLMDPFHEPGELFYEVKAIVRDFRCNHSDAAAVFHLAGLRKRRRKVESSVDWLRVIVHAKQALEEEPKPSSSPLTETGEGFSTAFCEYHIPQLRDSQYIRKLKLNKKEMSDKFSDKTFTAAHSILLVLQTRSFRIISALSERRFRSKKSHNNKGDDSLRKIV